MSGYRPGEGPRGSGGAYDYVTWLLANSVPALDVVWGASSGSGSEEDAFARCPYKGSPPDLTPAANLSGKPTRPKKEGREGTTPRHKLA